MSTHRYFSTLLLIWGSLTASYGYGALGSVDHVAEREVRNVRHPAGAVTLDNPLPDTTATSGTRFTYKIPTNTFDNEDSDPLAYIARLTNGDPLPDWLTFDATTVTFAGVPAKADYGTLAITVTAQNADNQSASSDFALKVRAVPEVDLNGPFIERRRHYDSMKEDEADSVAIVDPAMFIEDVDGNAIIKAIISFSEADSYDQREEYLLITEEGMQIASDAGIKANDETSAPSYDAVTGDIAVVGTASLEEYARFFREILYVNISEDVIGGLRTIAFLVTDADGNESNISITDIDVIPQNDPPTLDIDVNDDNGEGDFAYRTTFVEDGPAVLLTDRDVRVTDVDHSDIAQIVVVIANRLDGAQEVLDVTGPLPSGFSYGYDIRNGEDLVINGEGSLADYEAALRQITYRNDSQDPDDTPRQISIMYNDLGINGFVYDTTVVYIVPKNDPPDARADTVVVAEYSRDNPFGIPPPSDVDNELAELTMTIDSLPGLGTVTRADGAPVSIGDVLSATYFDSLRYDTPDDYDGVTPPGRMVFTVTDDSAATATSRIIFIINNAPEADPFTVTTNEDVPYTFTLANFADGYSDAEGDTLAYVIVDTLPDEGWLLLEGDTVRIGDALRLTVLDSGKLILEPFPDANGTPYTSFRFRVKDGRAAISQPYVATVVVLPVSDPPVVDTVFVTGEEYQTLFFTANDFIAQFSDPENDTLTKIKVENLPTDGTLLLDGQPVAIGDEIPVDRLDHLAFEPDFGFDGITEFRWNGHDGSAYAERPALVIIIILEDNRISALNDTIRLVDVATYEGSLTTLVNNPTGGDFTFNTNPVVDPEHGTVRLREDGSYTYEITDGFVGTDAFTYEVCNTNNPPECAQATITIIVPPPLLVYEGFSPDNDGINDVWRVRGIEDYPNNHVRIFNRWGNLVFEIAGYDNEDRAWSSYSTAGLVAGDVPDGTYFYLIDLGNGQSPRSGYVIVNR